ncbi:MAG: NADH-quinone oxidoreductase subunit NuoE [Bdellovibrionales bacterium]|nr:NADH-quinone oxidoreductase subunit NuoE [Bdellovibrionales bacterium]
MEKKFDKAFYDEMERLEKFYPNREALMLPALHAAQRERGWLSEETMQEVADFLGVPKTRVKEVATFYHMFNRKPVGKHKLQFCNNIACWLRGSEELIHHAEQKLGIKLNETTRDGKFTITEVECLGSCGTAPVCQVNDDYHECLDVQSMDRLLQELK